ncbi:hypothetical protein [Dactylosporangium sp. CA-092794]|uniref:hypothetical protein n=1 Tax=Dactylosporangium sp. CA-092794 TaxID=3239929 RepID=UPI003D8D9441
MLELGHWSHLSAAAAGEQMRAVAGGEYPFMGDAFEGLEFFADGEDLAEGGVEELLRAMAPALRRHGVELRVEVVRLPTSDDDEYVLNINGRRCRVWGPADWSGRQAWHSATVRPLAVVNELLAECGATARVFTLYCGGNEGTALLLDPAVVDAVRLSGLVDPYNVPELPIDGGTHG